MSAIFEGYGSKLTAQDMGRVANGLELLEAKELVHTTISMITNNRLKENTLLSIPFSDRLNAWVKVWYEAMSEVFVFTDEDDFDSNDAEGTLARHIRRYRKTGKIHVWKGASDNTIFGNTIINWYFRAWHDYIHITQGLGYDFAGEVAVANIQAAQLPDSWDFERRLVNSEVVGQALYHEKYQTFVEDQRGFTITFLKTGKV